ncbi:MAG: LamG-like jellyroll fold domain-containing protein [Planctomycetota bacterium]|nr:LamG-like jellyroll fold domain-containing protein [Planctomycetota bacterium]
MSKQRFVCLFFVPLVLIPPLRAHHDENPNPRFKTSRANPLVLPLPDEKDAFFFVVFGDRTNGPPEGVKILAQAVADVNLLAPDLVMTVGDLVQGYNDTPEWLVEATEYKATMSQLACPWFPVVGNHDIYWRGKGAAPKGQHEANFETHFGPLWYAFEHKNSLFIALDSDEGDPATGKYTFNDPAGQRVSEEQFAWLTETLKHAKAAENVFVFLHHPRWLRGNYGDDWDRVHSALVAHGKVKAVFAGHIHRMRWDGVKDGIEYFTLATVGGDQNGFAAAGGYLHQYDVVTVRAGKINLASFPVGAAMDPRAISGETSDEVAKLAESLVVPHIEGLVAFESDLSVQGDVEIVIANPTKRAIEITLTPDSADSRWTFTPDHAHQVVKAGSTAKFPVKLQRPKGSVDAFYREALVALDVDYLADGLRVPLRAQEWRIPVDGRTLPQPDPSTAERALELDGKRDCLMLASSLLGAADGPLTVEGWFNARSFKKRVGFLNKTENAEFGMFLSDGVPGFTIHLDGKYVNVSREKTSVSANAWHHVAGVFDGAEVRLYVDGELVASKAGKGKRKLNDLPLMIGADVTKEATPESFFDGRIDEIRISKSARYTENFTPQRRFDPDGDALLLLHMDAEVGPWAYDGSGRGHHVTRIGQPVLVDVN